MKTHKITALALAAFISVSLCGCNNDTQSPDSEETSSSTTQSQDTGSSSNSIPDSTPESSGESSSDTSKIKEPLEFFGALNEPIDRNEIVRAGERVYNPITEQQELKDIPLDKMDESEYFTAYTDFAYYALPLYPCITNLDSEYDEVNIIFKDVPQEKKSDFLRTKKGDKLFDMTVTEAYSSFNIGSTGGKQTVLETHLSLKGSVTVNGYARVVPDDEYGYNVGDIIFIPVGKVDLPVVNFRYNYEDKSITRSTGSIGLAGDIYYTNEFANFTLGNINDTTADTGCLTRDGSFTKVSVTISEIEMDSNFDWFSTYKATIESITGAN